MGATINSVGFKKLEFVIGGFHYSGAYNLQIAHTLAVGILRNESLNY